MKRNPLPLYLFILTKSLIMLVFAGCNQPTLQRVPAKGVVKIDGKPAANIMVQAMPDSTKDFSGPTSSGITNENGEFELIAADQQPGAVPGFHIFTFFDLDEERPEQGEVATKPSRVPVHLNTTRGGLSFEIKAGTLIQIDLKK